MPPQYSVYPAQVCYSGQRRPYCALCVASILSIIDVSAMETVISLPIKNISTMLCDINCSELLRLHIAGQGTVVIYSLYRDTILSSVFSSLDSLRKRGRAHSTGTPSSVTVLDDPFSYNMMIQTSRPIGLRPSVPLQRAGHRTQPKETLANGYFPPCPCKVLVTPSGLQINDTGQNKVLCVPYNTIEAVTLNNGACTVSSSSAPDEKECNIILYGLSPFITEFVYILLRAYPYLRAMQLNGEGCGDQNNLFHAEECVAEKAALCSSIQNLENNSTTTLSSNSLSSHAKSPQAELATNEEKQENMQESQLKSLSSRAINSLEAFAHIESTLRVEHTNRSMDSETPSDQLSQPHTPDQPLSATQQSYVTAPQRILRIGDNQDLYKLSKSKIQDSAYFYKHLSGLYIPANISILQPPNASTLSISINTSDANYTIAVDRAFQGFDSAARVIRTWSAQSLRNASDVLDAARAEYLRNLPTYPSLEPIVLLSETHTLGVIPLLLGLREAQVICLQSSMRLFSTSIPLPRTKI